MKDLIMRMILRDAPIQALFRRLTKRAIPHAYLPISENHVSLRPLLDPTSLASLTGINGARRD
jgi:hypothetical protein